MDIKTNSCSIAAEERFRKHYFRGLCDHLMSVINVTKAFAKILNKVGIDLLFRP